MTKYNSERGRKRSGKGRLWEVTGEVGTVPEVNHNGWMMDVALQLTALSLSVIVV